jgi:hypothetical protein
VVSDVGFFDDVAVRNRRTLALTHNFGDTTSTIDRVSGGVASTLVSVPLDLVLYRLGPLAWAGRDLLYVRSFDVRGEGTTDLYEVDGRGTTTIRAALGEDGYEGRADPDGVTTYGFVEDLPPGCEQQFLHENPFESFGTVYSGRLASRPTDLLVDRGTTYVLDQAANDVVAVDRDGTVRTVAVLPPVVAPFLAGSGSHQENNPECALGLRYSFEARPTGMAMGRDGWLYVTVPVEASTSTDLRPLGSIVRIHPRTGEIRPFVTGLVGPRGLAISRTGDVYVELSSGLAVIPRGSVTPAPFLPSGDPVAVEGRALYVRTGAELLRVPIRR